MKKFLQFLILAAGITGFLASCQCKTCKKDGQISVTVCKDNATEDEYNQTLGAYQFVGYSCN